MNTSTEIEKISAAIVAVQCEMEAKEDAYNPFFKSKYAPISGILKAIRPSLKEHGVVAIQSIEVEEGSQRMKCVTRIIHESGQWIECYFSLDVANTKPQDFGSAASYCRRYGLCAALNIATNDDEDDDGNDAEKDKQKELLALKDKEMLDKVAGQILVATEKYTTDIITRAFEECGFVSIKEDRKEQIIDLIKQVPSHHKLTTIGRRFAALKRELESEAKPE